MEQDGFDVLERRVGDAVAALQQLRREQAEWTVRREELSSALADLQSRNGELEGELAQLRDSSIPRSEFEQRKALIEERVHKLLARFDELDASAGE